MVDIKNIDGTITFSYDGFTLPYVFVKVEQVAENSNYYCLWITEEEFHLFNIKTKEYALKINTYKESKIFSKIEYYSKDTRSFVAYRSDKEYAYLLFEDGEYENYVFKYVGKELNGIRAVKGHNNKWMYYNVLKKVFTFSINKGLLLRDDEELVPLFDIKYYTIYKVDLYYRLISFDVQKHKTYYSDRIESFEDTENNCVIGKLFNRNVYALFKITNLITPIGYFNSKPRYVDTRNVFIAKKLNSYVIIDGNKEISNCQWTEDCFLFHNNYILNKSTRGKWKLYSFDNGKEICTNWTNIRYDLELCCIIADTDKQKNKKITESDIGELYSLIYNKSIAFHNEVKKTNEVPALLEDKDFIGNGSNEKEESNVESNDGILKGVKANFLTKQANALPKRINYLTFIGNARITDDGFLLCSRNVKLLNSGCYICWIVKKNRSIIVTELLGTKAYKLIYYKENVNLDIFNFAVKHKNFIEFHIEITNESDFYTQLNNWQPLSSYIVKDKSKVMNIINHLPSHIDFCIFVNELCFNTETNEFEYVEDDVILLKKHHICWIIKKEQCLVISKYIGKNKHKVIFYKINNLGLRFYNERLNEFLKIRISLATEAKITNKINKIIKTLQSISNNSEQNIEITESTYEQFNRTHIEKSEFIFDSVPYSLRINDVWKDADIFSRRQFVYKQNLIAILLDSTSRVFVDDNITYYEIVGEGKDPRFNQDFGPVNKAIRDNTKQIILFSKKEDGVIRFTDEVICEGYSIKFDKNCIKNISRKIIVFKLRSLMTFRQDNPENEITKTVDTSVITSNVEAENKETDIKQTQTTDYERGYENTQSNQEVEDFIVEMYKKVIEGKEIFSCLRKTLTEHPYALKHPNKMKKKIKKIDKILEEIDSIIYK